MSEKKAVYVNGYIGLIGLVLLVSIGGFLFYFGMTSERSSRRSWVLFVG